MPIRLGRLSAQQGTRITESAGGRPFAGIRILGFTRYVAGPFGTYRLA